MLKPCEPEELLFRVSCCLEKLELKRKIKACSVSKEKRGMAKSSFLGCLHYVKRQTRSSGSSR